MTTGGFKVLKYGIGKTTVGDQRLRDVPWEASFTFAKGCGMPSLEVSSEKLAELIGDLEARGEAVPEEFRQALTELKRLERS